MVFYHIYLRIYQLLWELCLYVDHLCGILWDFYDWGTSLPSLSLQVDRCFATLSLALKWTIFTGDLVHFHFEQCPICTDTLSSRWKNFLLLQKPSTLFSSWSPAVVWWHEWWLNWHIVYTHEYKQKCGLFSLFNEQLVPKISHAVMNLI